ncbi:alpha/beta-hydrolase [Pseudovirgaria hyperparasitica]|uniref:Alpha/beta-hydrolase n=1 Tax=Pseudovirgaria hyperparasitica TaxID=470096 RepID=A0A6A6WHD5_9PEZI|nr:alpha/beta-hydrolase [Pseudovirgaria hyperparasitica]KAF2762212.1 alpha/beta-hydrolase [Pseudovirgaria hyperparasitica]
MGNSSHPTFVFVPGALSPVAQYQHVVDLLRARHFDATIVATPSVGFRPGPAATMFDDAAAISSVTQALANEGKHTILVMHSYGGVPGTQSVKGVSAKERKSDGKSGGVKRLVYVNAIIPGLGESVRGLFGTQLPAFLKLVDDRLINIDPAASARNTYNPLAFTKALEWAQGMQPHSDISYQGAVSSLGYDHAPVSYLRCTKDMIVVPELSSTYYQKIADRTGTKPDLYEIETGHCPNASAPDELVDILIEIASKEE